jgi:hypothetical protein
MSEIVQRQPAPLNPKPAVVVVRKKKKNPKKGNKANNSEKISNKWRTRQPMTGA